MKKKQLTMCLTNAALFGLAAGAVAAPFSVTFTDTATTSDTFPAGINAGQQFSVKFVLDNGNSAAANQSWSADNVQCVIFTFNNAQDKNLAIDYSVNPFTSSTSGNFTTNGTGQLQTGTISWFDDGPIANPQVTNVAGFSGANAWFINGGNDVVNFNSTNVSVGMATVANNVQVTNWSNPVPAANVCAGFLAPKAVVVQQVPTLTQWGMIVLSGLLAVAALLTLHRRRQ